MASPRGTPRLGEGSVCPHCGAKAGLSPEEEGYICLVCGGPVIFVEGDVPRPRAEGPLLERVKRLRARRAAWAVGSALVGAFGLLAAVLALVIATFVDLGVGASVALGAITLVPIALALVGWRRAMADGRAASEALADAQRVVASELLAANPGTSTAELAQRLRITEDAALELAAHAQVGGLLSSGADIKYRVGTGVEEEHPTDAHSAEEARQSARRGS